MERWKRVGFDEKVLPQALKNFRESYDLLDGWGPNAMPGVSRAVDVDTLFLLVAMHHLQIAGTPGEGLQCARRGVEAALNYFYGDWRAKHVCFPRGEEEIWDAAKCRRELLGSAFIGSLCSVL